MKCPHCQQNISSPDLKGPTIGNKTFGPLLVGYTAVCTNLACQAVLGVTPDPQWIVDQVLKKLGAR